MLMMLLLLVGQIQLGPTRLVLVGIVIMSAAAAATIAASLADHLQAEVRSVSLKERMMKGTGIGTTRHLTESPAIEQTSDKNLLVTVEQAGQINTRKANTVGFGWWNGQ